MLCATAPVPARVSTTSADALVARYSWSYPVRIRVDVVEIFMHKEKVLPTARIRRYVAVSPRKFAGTPRSVALIAGVMAVCTGGTPEQG